MLADVTSPADATTVQDVPPSKRGSCRLLQSLAAIGHDEPATLYLQATLEELAQELTADCSALGGAFDDAQNVLVAIRVDAERADLSTWRPIWMPSNIITGRCSSPGGRLGNASTLRFVCATKRRETLDLLAPEVSIPSKSSRLRSYLRLDTPQTICSSACFSSGSWPRYFLQAGSTISRPPRLRSRGFSNRILRPPVLNRLDSWPCRTPCGAHCARAEGHTEAPDPPEASRQTPPPELHHQTQQRLTATLEDLLETARRSANTGLFLLILLSDSLSHNGDSP